MFLNKKKIQNLNSMYLNLKKVIILIMSKGKNQNLKKGILLFIFLKKKLAKSELKGIIFLMKNDNLDE